MRACQCICGLYLHNTSFPLIASLKSLMQSLQTSVKTHFFFSSDAEQIVTAHRELRGVEEG